MLYISRSQREYFVFNWTLLKPRMNFNYFNETKTSYKICSRRQYLSFSSLIGYFVLFRFFSFNVHHSLLLLFISYYFLLITHNTRISMNNKNILNVIFPMTDDKIEPFERNTKMNWYDGKMCVFISLDDELKTVFNVSWDARWR